jgi:hypothetical protein
MKKQGLQILVAISLVGATWMNPVQAAETRCGWLANPTPGNYFLFDGNGPESGWTISAQGGYEAVGADKIPDISAKEYVKTNGEYGYGCACLSVDADKKTERIVKIYSFKQLPLKKCKADKKLPPME